MSSERQYSRYRARHARHRLGNAIDGRKGAASEPGEERPQRMRWTLGLTIQVIAERIAHRPSFEV
jgi:hypothetical protein